MTETNKDVEIARLVTPRFLSLVGLPANQVAFKIIRDDNGDPTMTAPHIQRKRASRRADRLVSIDFDLSTSEEDIGKAMEEWGIDKYKIETTEEGRRVLCSDAGGAPTMRIHMGDGRVATVLQPISNTTADQEKPHVAVVRMEFAADYFPSTADVESWCRKHAVDFDTSAIQNAEQEIVVSRGVKVGLGDETRVVQVDDGVQFVVARAEAQDIPDPFIVVISDTAYGNWGWGQLDFTAVMADVEFSEVSQEAIRNLNRVIERILYSSDLPITVRKELISRAAGQFAEFISGLMDALPARVVIANRSTFDEEKSMKPKEKKEEAAPAGTEQTADTAVSRSDVEKLVNDAVGGLAVQIAELTTKLSTIEAGQQGETTARTDEGGAGGAEGKGEAEAGTGEGKEEAGGETLAEVLRSVTAIAQAVTSVSDRVGALEGGTTVRSDDRDAEQKVIKKDVFRGVFGATKQA